MSEYATLTERLLELAQTKGALQERIRITNLLKAELQAMYKIKNDLKSRQAGEKYINALSAKIAAVRQGLIYIQPE